MQVNHFIIVLTMRYCEKLLLVFWIAVIFISPIFYFIWRIYWTKPTICHDFASPDLLEGPKDGNIKRKCKVFFILKSSNKIHYIVYLTTDHKVYMIYNQWIHYHSMTGVNIIIFHDGLFNISYCHYNYKTSFWKSQCSL